MCMHAHNYLLCVWVTGVFVGGERVQAGLDRDRRGMAQVAGLYVLLATTDEGRSSMEGVPGPRHTPTHPCTGTRTRIPAHLSPRPILPHSSRKAPQPPAARPH